MRFLLTLMALLIGVSAAAPAGSAQRASMRCSPSCPKASSKSAPRWSEAMAATLVIERAVPVLDCLGRGRSPPDEVRRADRPCREGRQGPDRFALRCRHRRGNRRDWPARCAPRSRSTTRLRRDDPRGTRGVDPDAQFPGSRAPACGRCGIDLPESRDSGPDRGPRRGHRSRGPTPDVQSRAFEEARAAALIRDSDAAAEEKAAGRHSRPSPNRGDLDCPRHHPRSCGIARISHRRQGRAGCAIVADIERAQVALGIRPRTSGTGSRSARC